MTVFLCWEEQSRSNHVFFVSFQGAYQAFVSYLRNNKMWKVKGIPDDQLKIASLGKARLDKGFPSAQKIISYGVPRGLATTLAPFQRGGVDFVMERNGRALIADGRSRLGNANHLYILYLEKCLACLRTKLNQTLHEVCVEKNHFKEQSIFMRM